MEQWLKVNCPNCKKSNWLPMGDPLDITGFDVTALECWDCHKKYKFDEEGSLVKMKNQKNRAESGLEYPN